MIFRPEITSLILTAFRAKTAFPRLFSDRLFTVSTCLSSNATNSIQVSIPKPPNYTFTPSVTHSSRGVAKVDLEAPHGSDDGDDGLDGVAVDYSLVLLTFFF